MTRSPSLLGMLKLSAAALFVAAALSCTTSKGAVSLNTPDNPSWSEEVKSHTRRAQTYNIPDLVAEIDATLVTPRLRSAFIHDREKFHGRVANELEMELLAMGRRPDEGMDRPVLTHAASEEQVLVIVTFFVADQRYRDLAASYSVWDTTLVRGKASVKPLRVEELRNDVSTAALFPHTDRFDKVYLLRFPLVDLKTGAPMLSPGGDPLSLQVHSALGDLDAEWTLEE